MSPLRAWRGVCVAVISGLAVGGWGCASTVGAATGQTEPAAAPSSLSSPPRGLGRFAVGLEVVTFVDRSRTVRIPGHGRRPRTLVTLVRYPAVGAPNAAVDRRGAAPARSRGPFPLVVFGHGFAVTPTPYAALLRSWASAGYVVASPIFPLENANAPGGPDETDLVNQPRDMSFVITRMLALSARGSGPLAGLISARRIAVAGQSDGGETALAAAYLRPFLDRRIRAAMILSGARLPGVPGFENRPIDGWRPPALLAVQGTADTINHPHFTYDFFHVAARPKFLLRLLGAGHLPPYTSPGPDLRTVERVSVAFLDAYLSGSDAPPSRIRTAGSVRGLAALTADP